MSSSVVEQLDTETLRSRSPAKWWKPTSTRLPAGSVSLSVGQLEVPYPNQDLVENHFVDHFYTVDLVES